jgi:hypothetical protein
MMEYNQFEAPEAFDPLCVSAEGILSTTLGNQIHINKIEPNLPLYPVFQR